MNNQSEDLDFIPNQKNKLRHKCNNLTGQCFNKLYRPHLEMLNDSLIDKVAFMDIDGAVECRGHLLFIEWKTDDGKLGTGQEIFFREAAKHNSVSVIIGIGNHKTMECTAARYFHHEVDSGWFDCSREDIRFAIGFWHRWAYRTPHRITS